MAQCWGLLLPVAVVSEANQSSLANQDLIQRGLWKLRNLRHPALCRDPQLTWVMRCGSLTDRSSAAPQNLRDRGASRSTLAPPRRSLAQNVAEKNGVEGNKASLRNSAVRAKPLDRVPLAPLRLRTPKSAVSQGISRGRLWGWTCTVS